LAAKGKDAMKRLPNFKWMPESRWFFGGLGLLLLWLGGSNWVSYRNSTQLIESNQQILRSYEIIQNLTSIYADLTVAESGRRGYVLLNEQGELDRYQNGIYDLESEMLNLRQKVSQDPEQSKRLDAMEILVRQRLDLLAESIVAYQANATLDQRQSEITKSSVQLRTQIQARLGEMKNLEETRLRRWLQASQNRMNDRFLIEGWWLVSGFLVVTLGLYVVNEQLTQRRKSDAQREKLLQQKELDALKLQFFSMASHEFRTPLSVILGSSQLLMSSHQSGDREKMEKNTLRIQASAKAMTQLLNDILTLARAEAGSLICQRDRLELASFCLNLVEDIDLANSHRHRIQFVRRSSQTYASLDEKLLYLILSNLLLNAIKYSAAGSDIQLILEDFIEGYPGGPLQDRRILFKVIDQGQGIVADDLPNLYKPFYRGQNIGSIAGTGLGLAVVKTCVDLHEGTIAIDSQPGQGSTFTLSIPTAALSLG
jgi:signal transduction histidine kinase